MQNGNTICPSLSFQIAGNFQLVRKGHITEYILSFIKKNNLAI